MDDTHPFLFLSHTHHVHPWSNTLARLPTLWCSCSRCPHCALTTTFFSPFISLVDKYSEAHHRIHPHSLRPRGCCLRPVSSLVSLLSLVVLGQARNQGKYNKNVYRCYCCSCPFAFFFFFFRWLTFIPSHTFYLPFPLSMLFPSRVTFFFLSFFWCFGY